MALPVSYQMNGVVYITKKDYDNLSSNPTSSVTLVDATTANSGNAVVATYCSQTIYIIKEESNPTITQAIAADTYSGVAPAQTQAIWNLVKSAAGTTYTISYDSNGNAITLTSPNDGTTLANGTTICNTSIAVSNLTGQVASGVTKLVDGGTVYSAIASLSSSIDTKLSGAFHYIGSVTSYADLPTTASAGDVYNVTTSTNLSTETDSPTGNTFYPAGTNFVRSKSNTWDPLGGETTLSNTNTGTNSTISFTIGQQAYSKTINEVAHSTSANTINGVGVATGDQASLITATSASIVTASAIYTYVTGYAYDKSTMNTWSSNWSTSFSTLSERVTTLETNLNTNSNRIEALETASANHATSIATNGTKIAANTTAIQDHATALAGILQRITVTDYIG